MNRRKFLGQSVAASAMLSFFGFTDSKETLPDLQQLNQLPDAQYWKKLRRQFPMPLDEAYFNTGTLGAQPKVVLEKVIESMRYNAVNCAKTDYKGNGPMLLSGYAPYPELRKKIGQLINADYTEIALTQNATFGMNYLSNGLDLKEGDEIINTDQEHGGGRAGWEVAAARYNLVYKQAKIPVPANDPQEIIDNIFKEVTSRTRVIAIPHIISVYGVVLPVKEICQEARRRGILTVLDGAQAVGQVPVDVQDIGCDAYFSSLHKWLLAPAGSGILYVRKDLIENLWTTLASYNWNNQEDHGFRLTQRGTGDPSQIIGVEAAVDFYNEIGPEKVTDRIKFLGDYLRAGLKEIPKVTIYSSVHPTMCAGITTYGIEGMNGPDLQKEMWRRKKLQPRSAGEDVIRHSTHIYNLEHEIDAALKVLRDLAG